MSRSTLCRLCVTSCNEFKCLLDDHGQLNGVYKVAVKYFHPSLLNPVRQDTPKVICIECWQHINDFNNYQESVINIQYQLEYLQPVVIIDKSNQDHPNKQPQVTTTIKTEAENPLYVFDILQFNEIKPEPTHDDEFIDKILSNSEVKKEKDIQDNPLKKHHIEETVSRSYSDAENDNDSVLYESYSSNMQNNMIITSEIENENETIEKSSPFEIRVDQPVNSNIADEPTYSSYMKNTTNFMTDQPFKSHYDEFIRKVKGDLDCPKCQDKLTDFKALRQHFQTKHNSEKPYTICCNIKLITRTHITRHLRLHINPNAYQCNICEKILKTSWSLKLHKRTKHSNKSSSSQQQILEKDDFITKWLGKLECAICKKHMDNYSLLAWHFKVKHRCKEFITCCGRKLRMRWRIVKHIREIHMKGEVVEQFSKDHGELQKYITQTNDFTGEIVEQFSNEDDKLHINIKSEHTKELLNDINEEDSSQTFNDLANDETHTLATDPNMEIETFKKMSEDQINKINRRISNENNILNQEHIIDTELTSSSVMNTEDYDISDKNFKNILRTIIGDLECPICKVIAIDFPRLSEHFRYKHFTETPFIICCNKKLYHHQISHHLSLFHGNQINYQCNICEKNLTNKWNLKIHKHNVHGSGTVLSSKYYKKTSDVSHSDKQRTMDNDATIAQCLGDLECTICKRKFATYTLLGIHFRLQHSAHECLVVCCGRKFRLRWKLLKHVRQKHMGVFDQKLCKCSICFKTFSHDYKLRIHIQQMHKTIFDQHDDHKCKVCEASFGKEQYLIAHYSRYHKEYPLPGYECQYCNLIFQTQISLEKHINKKHSQLNIQNNDLSKDDCNQETMNVQKEISKTLLEDEIDFQENNINNDEMDKEVITAINKKTGRNDFYVTVSKHNDEIPKISLKKQSLILDIGESQAKDILNANSDKHIEMPTLDIYDIKEEISCDSSINSAEDTDTEQQFELQPSLKNYESRLKTKRYDEFIKNIKGDLECPKCNMLLEDFALLNKHFQTVHAPEKAYIICCKLKHPSRMHIARHLRLHTNPNAYQCDVCKRNFKNLCNLGDHKKRVHNSKRSQKEHKCDMCEASFKLERYLRVHYSRNHAEEYPAYLMRLDSVNAKTRLYDDHIKRVKGDLECPICNMSLGNFTLLRQHFQSEHDSNRPYIICCKLKHPSRMHISRHIRLHTNPNAYQCNVCERNFKTLFNLENHKKHVHKNKDSQHEHKCDVCKASFRKERYLRAHYSRNHKEFPLPDYMCQHCDLIFATQTSLEKHIKKEHTNMAKESIEGPFSNS